MSETKKSDPITLAEVWTVTYAFMAMVCLMGTFLSPNASNAITENSDVDRTSITIEAE